MSGRKELTIEDLPTWDECNEKYTQFPEDLDALEKFILDNEPEGKLIETEFRQCLVNMLNHFNVKL